MTPAVLALSILFVADDPTLPTVAMQVVEEAGARALTVIITDGRDDAGHAATAFAIRDNGGRAFRPTDHNAWPAAPLGASVTPAVDGVIITIDDAGEWAAAFAPAPVDPAAKPKKAGRPPKSPHPWPPPSLPVAGPRSLRLFVPTAVDDAPDSASLHGPDGLRVPGFAAVWHRPFGPDGSALTVADGGADASAARPIGGELAVGCGPPPDTVMQRVTTATARPVVACEGGLRVVVLEGIRRGDQPAKDSAAHGVFVVAPGPADRPMSSPASSPTGQPAANREPPLPPTPPPAAATDASR